MAMVRASETATPLECEEKKGGLPLPSLSLLSAKRGPGGHPPSVGPTSLSVGPTYPPPYFPLPVNFGVASVQPPFVVELSLSFVLIFVSL